MFEKNTFGKPQKNRETAQLAEGHTFPKKRHLKMPGKNHSKPLLNFFFNWPGKKNFAGCHFFHKNNGGVRSKKRKTFKGMNDQWIDQKCFQFKWEQICLLKNLQSFKISYIFFLAKNFFFLQKKSEKNWLIQIMEKSFQKSIKCWEKISITEDCRR